jgi:S-adenosylmethionine synthetase
MKTYFTSESVTCGHPDKVCDQIADGILDEILKQDPAARCAVEATCTTNQAHIFGEVTTTAKVDYAEKARQVIAAVGYTAPGRGFDADSCRITVDLHEQSPDIAMGIDRSGPSEALDSGAGDQGIMFGFACRETENLMPLPIELAHSLAKRLEQVRRSSELPYLLPDGKTQVTVEYEDGAPKRVSTVIVSAQHREDADISRLRDEILNHVILPTLPKELLSDDTQYFINPTGRFVVGGPAGDSGLTGRKIIADTYGGCARHGGGAFSGKDATKVDRSGAYMARYLAKNIAAAGLADRCEVQLGYAIGLAEPVSLRVDTFGTETVSPEKILRAVQASADLRPYAIIEKFGLRRPIYSRLACYGHFGANAVRMPWERTDLAEELRRLCRA